MFDEAYPDALDNALRIDNPVRKPAPGFWAGSGRALLTGPTAAVLDVGSVFSSMLTPQAGAPEVRARTEAYRARREEAATTMRGTARELTPDSEVAGTAAMVIHGFGRVLTKAVPLALAGGVPAAALGTGAIEGIVETQNLTDEGVVLATARKVGATKAVMTAAQIALPMSAATKAGTAALIAAGGPGGYMVEQAVVRKILDDANYGEIARRYDPFDPVGLTVATLMSGTFGVGGHAIRASRAKRAAMDAEAQASLGTHEMTPDMQAAARVWQASEHVQDTGLGQSGNLAAAASHVDALESALRSIDAGERVNVGEIVPVEHLAESGAGRGRTQEALNFWAEQNARQHAVERTRLELLAEASGRADPGVVRGLEAERAPIEQKLADLEASFKDLAKAAQGEGLSRKQAEAQARKQIADMRIEFEGQLQRLDQQLEANRRGAKAEQDLAAVESGDIPEHLRAAIDQRIAEARQGVQPKPIAAAVQNAFPQERVHAALQAEGLPVTQENVSRVAQIAHARRLDPKAVDALPESMPDGEYMAKIKEIVNAKQEPAKADQGGGQPGGQGPGAEGSEAGQAAQAGEAARGRGGEAQPGGEGARGVTEKAPDAVDTAAAQAADLHPDAMVPHPETGVLVQAKQLLKDAEEFYQQQVRDSKAYQAAVTCFLGH